MERLVQDSAGHKKIILYSVPGKDSFYKKFGFMRRLTAMAIFQDREVAIRRVHLGEAQHLGQRRAQRWGAWPAMPRGTSSASRAKHPTADPALARTSGPSLNRPPATQTLLLYFLIVGCEVAFWLVLLASLAVRYVLHQDAVSRWLLRSLPLIDLLLLAFTAMDLKAGTTATFAHGLAAVYVGFTLAFGGIAVRWADAQFAYRFASGPAPAKAPSGGWEVFRFDLTLWLRCIAAWIVALALIQALVAFIGNEAATRPLLTWYKYGFSSVVLWFIFGPLWSLFLVRRGAR